MNYLFLVQNVLRSFFSPKLAYFIEKFTSYKILDGKKTN